ncbi:MAG: F0F1 ATP synthase subunit A [Chloroflexi bacterium]|nr:F0F1 ATP synthase subunit A [Chloroflexota bacterium]
MPKRRVLGCSFPLLAVIAAALLGLFLVSFLSGALGRSLIGDVGLPGWLSVPAPDPKLPPEAVFHLLGFPVTNSIISAWLTIAVLVGVSYVVTRRLKLVPNRLQALLESAIGWLYDLCREVAGEKNGRRFFPVVATIFFFVLMNAWLSLLPIFGSINITTAGGEHVHLFRGANTDINLPLALALVSFIFVEYHGIRLVGARHYIAKFINAGRFFGGLGQLFRGSLRAGLVGVLTGGIDIFVGLLEALSEFIRIISFTFRLFGNMTAGEILLLLVTFLVPWLAVIPFYGLELLVGLVQALIFSGLTLVFATMAVTHHKEETA